MNPPGSTPTSTPTTDGIGHVPVRVVTLRVGRLDGDSTSRARTLLRELADQPDTAVTVDLTHMDREHELTLDALLADAADRTAGTTTTLRVLRPTERLAASLSASGIPVQSRDAPHDPVTDAEVLQVGTLPEPAGIAPPATPSVDRPSHHSEIFDLDGTGERYSTHRCLCGNRWPCE